MARVATDRAVGNCTSARNAAAGPGNVAADCAVDNCAVTIDATAVTGLTSHAVSANGGVLDSQCPAVEDAASEAARVAKPSSVVVADRAVIDHQRPAIKNAATGGVAGVATNTALSNR